jgi:hypothetical protein
MKPKNEPPVIPQINISANGQISEVPVPEIEINPNGTIKQKPKIPPELQIKMMSEAPPERQWLKWLLAGLALLIFLMTMGAFYLLPAASKQKDKSTDIKTIAPGTPLKK